MQSGQHGLFLLREQALAEKTIPEFTPELGGMPYFSIRGNIANYSALLLLLEPDTERRGEMAKHFSPPDPAEWPFIFGAHSSRLLTPPSVLEYEVFEKFYISSVFGWVFLCIYLVEQPRHPCGYPSLSGSPSGRLSEVLCSKLGRRSNVSSRRIL